MREESACVNAQAHVDNVRDREGRREEAEARGACGR